MPLITNKSFRTAIRSTRWKLDKQFYKNIMFEKKGIYYERVFHDKSSNIYFTLSIYLVLNKLIIVKLEKKVTDINPRTTYIYHQRKYY